jgi:hypothetical protein
MSEQIDLGDVARDVITGFEGVVVSRHEYLHGCARLSIQPRALHEGTPVETQTFDEPQLALISRRGTPWVQPTTGGPRPEPTPRAEPPRR